MKSLLKRLLALILCALICLPATGFTYGPTLPGEFTVSSASWDPITGYSGETYSTAVLPPAASATPVEVSSYDEAINYAREQLKARVPQFAIQLPLTNEVENEKKPNVVFDDCFVHTKEPKEGDYLKYQMYISMARSWNDTVMTYYFGYGVQDGMLVDSPVEYYSDAAQEAAVDSAVAELKATLGLDKMTKEYDKIVAIYNWMCENIEYDYDNLNDDSYKLKYTAYAALVGKKSVCQGYANLFYRMMLEIGVDARIISGYGVDLTDLSAERHAWNIVGPSNRDYYYYIDATWGAGPVELWPKFFMRGIEDGFFDNTHYPDDEYATDEWNAKYPIDPKAYVDDEEEECLHNGETHYENKSDATCTEPGYTGDLVCDICGEIISKGTEIAALGHDWNDEGKCSRCGAEKPKGIRGDLDNSGKIDVLDGVVMQRILAGIETDPDLFEAANLNGDKTTDVLDGVIMQRILAGLE